MGRKKQLSTPQRGAILYGYDRGDSYSTIADAVGYGRTTVFDLVKCVAETGSSSPKSRSGRPVFQRKHLKGLMTDTRKQSRRLCARRVQALWVKPLPTRG